MGFLGIFEAKAKEQGREEARDWAAVMKRAAKIYRGTKSEMGKRIKAVIKPWEGLGERDQWLLLAADAGLIPPPAYLATRLEVYQREKAEFERIVNEAGVVVDQLGAALDLLRGQPWWADFIAGIRQELGIRGPDDIGRWHACSKKLAPYVYEAGYVYQTHDDYRNDGPVAVWMWRVDLKAGTAESIVPPGSRLPRPRGPGKQGQYYDHIDNLADKMIGCSFAMGENESFLQYVENKENLDLSSLAFEHMLCYSHLVDRYAFGLYGAEFRETVMASLDEALLRKFADAYALDDDKIEKFTTIFIDTLNERNADYANYELPNGKDLDPEERLDWEFGKRIAALVGGRNPVELTACVRAGVIAGLAVIQSTEELKKLKELIDPDSIG